MVASVVVVNHNYGRFLRTAIDSALAQTYLDTEVVVVDDGSRDDSRSIIGSYGDEVVAVLQQNGGQAAAWNSGLKMATGEAICFLDADDQLAATAIQRSLPLLAQPGVVKVHWPLCEVDGEGRTSGLLAPRERLPRGYLKATVVSEGPHSYPTPAASGKLWSREFLERVMPLPPAARRAHGADVYVSTVAPLYGAIERVDEPMGYYRLHGSNNWASMSFDEQAQFDLAAYRLHCEALARHCAALGIPADPERWKRNSWLHRRVEAAAEIAARVPAGDSFVLIDRNEWGMDETAGRRAIPFLERGGRYWGLPQDDAEAVEELERRRRAGTRFVAVGWPAFWSLEHYGRMRGYLYESSHEVAQGEHVIVFALSPQ